MHTLSAHCSVQHTFLPPPLPDAPAAAPSPRPEPEGPASLILVPTLLQRAVLCYTPPRSGVAASELGGASGGLVSAHKAINDESAAARSAGLLDFCGVDAEQVWELPEISFMS